MEEQTQLQIVRCPACGEFLPAGRVNLRFHNSRCRSRYWRRLRDITVHSELIQRYLAEYASLIEAGDGVPEIKRQLDDIENTLLDCRAAIQHWVNRPAESLK